MRKFVRIQIDAISLCARSLRGIREGITKRMKQMKGAFLDDTIDVTDLQTDEDEGLDILQELQSMLQGANPIKRFELPDRNISPDEQFRKRSLGLPDDCALKPHNNFLILKPQIALRSKVDADSIVLLAMEEISFQGYRVLDQSTSDVVAANVLDRYGFQKPRSS